MRSLSWARPAALAIVALLAIGAAGCGTSGGRPVTTAPGAASGIVAEVVSYQLVAGMPGRLLVALFDADTRWLSFGSLDVRFSFLGNASASGSFSDVVLGPATAEFLPIPGSPDGPERSPKLTFPADGRGVYSVEPISFPRPGFWQVSVEDDLADGSRVRADAAFTVLAAPTVIGVGMLAPHTDNPVIGDPGIPLGALDSRAVNGDRIPDPELHARSIADALALGHPALIVFSTPVYCVSRFCGPVTDLAAKLAVTYADRADFIHVEIYRDFAAGTVNQAAHDWLSTPNGDLREPWTFLIGADGRIAGSWDTVVTQKELEPLLAALPRLTGAPVGLSTVGETAPIRAPGSPANGAPSSQP